MDHLLTKTVIWYGHGSNRADNLDDLHLNLQRARAWAVKIQQWPTPEVTQAPDPSVEELGHKLMNPYVMTLEVLALLLTAALIGAVTAAQGIRKPKEEGSPE